MVLLILWLSVRYEPDGLDNPGRERHHPKKAAQP
jgi:hypothetical protein